MSLSAPRFWAMPFLLLMFYLRCIPALVRLHPSICIAHQLDSLPLALFLRSIEPNVKVIFDNEDVYSLMVSRSSPSVFHGIIRSLEKMLASRADLCIFPNSAMRKYVGMENCPKVLLLPNLPEVDFERNKARSTIQKNTDDQEFTITYFGLITRYRGLETLIKAIGSLSDRGINVSVLLIGNGPLARELKDLAAFIGVTKRVRFLGRVASTRIPSLVLSCDASAVLNTKGDPMNIIGNPNKLYESMALGIPVLASNFGEIAEIVKGANCGLLVDPDDVSSIVDGIMTLSKDSALRRQLSENGIDAMKTKYSREGAERSLLEAISRLAGSKVV